MENKAFRILAISAGRPMACTETFVKEALMEMERLGDIEPRIIRLRTLKLDYCDGCLACLESLGSGGEGLCHIKDDLEWVKQEVKAADAVIYALPSFYYMPPAETIIILNRALGIGKTYAEESYANPKPVALIAIGGSNTVDFTLPLQYAAMERLSPGMKLVDQFYGNWTRGKGYVALQSHHMARSRKLGARLMNHLLGKKTPDPVKLSYLYLNPSIRQDDIRIDLSLCPACYSSAFRMGEYGAFQCVICGATGNVEYHGGKFYYEWDDESVAYNRFTPEGDAKFLGAYKTAHMPGGDKQGKGETKEGLRLVPGKEMKKGKPRLLAIVSGAGGGTSEILAGQALQAGADAQGYEAAMIRLQDIRVGWCTGCLSCGTDMRVDGEGKCVLKDNFEWLLAQIREADGLLVAADVLNLQTNAKLISCLNRGLGCGNSHRLWAKSHTLPLATMVFSLDGETGGAPFATTSMANIVSGESGKKVASEIFTNVPLKGDKVLSDQEALERAGNLGKKLAFAVGQVLGGTPIADVNAAEDVCPSCHINVVDFHPDGTFSCPLCFAFGKFERRFGENAMIWDEYSVTHSRYTDYGKDLHYGHIMPSQIEELDLRKNPKLLSEITAPYEAYGKIVRPPVEG